MRTGTHFAIRLTQPRRHRPPSERLRVRRASSTARAVAGCSPAHRTVGTPPLEALRRGQRPLVLLVPAALQDVHRHESREHLRGEQWRAELEVGLIPYVE